MLGQKSLSTYLLSADSSSGGNYKSTLPPFGERNQVAEAKSHGQKPIAAIFVTREDDDDQTHVQFGDGITGVPPPSGTSCIDEQQPPLHGSGAAVHFDAGKLTTIVTAQPDSLTCGAKSP